jgi:hypothetical protein
VLCGRRRIAGVGHLLVGVPAAAFAIIGAVALLQDESEVASEPV